ncbi:NAD-dependent epimerase/dehydratase family protein [Rubritalea sp.]|uniref:NAD-dependent epimerase/dehydratase family protein n=1 Tax=Rubritalea sp. TaxID=2109375 RepID=UPI003EF1D5A3
MNHLLLVGNGFVGKVTVKLFRKNGWEVTAVSRCGESDEHADVSSKESMLDLKQRISAPTHIVHCASASGGGAEVYRQVYQEGCQNLVEVFPGVPILFTSSTSVYPQTDGLLVDENSPTELDRLTGQILLASEASILASGGVVARLAGVYGNGRSYLLRRFLSGEATMEEKGERILNHTHNEDAASAIFHLLNNCHARGQIYNVCDSQPKSQSDTYHELSKMFGRSVPASAPRNLNSKRGWSHKAVSNAKIVNSGWQPTYPSFTEVAEDICLTL